MKEQEMKRLIEENIPETPEAFHDRMNQTLNSIVVQERCQRMLETKNVPVRRARRLSFALTAALSLVLVAAVALERVRPSVRKYAGKRGSGDAVGRVPANDQQCGDHRGRGRLRRQDPVPAVALSDAGRGPHAGRPRRERPVFRRPAASGRPQRGLVDRPYLDQRQGHRHARQLRRGRAGQQRTRRDHRKLVLSAGQRRPVSAGRQDRDLAAHRRTAAP